MYSFAAWPSLLMVLLAAIYLLRYRNHPPTHYSPAAAWLRAGMYF